MVFVLLGKEGCLILKHKKMRQSLNYAAIFFTFITYYDLEFLDES